MFLFLEGKKELLKAETFIPSVFECELDGLFLFCRSQQLCWFASWKDKEFFHFLELIKASCEWRDFFFVDVEVVK